MGVLTTVYAVDKPYEEIAQLVNHINYKNADEVVVGKLRFDKDWYEIEYMLKGFLPKKDLFYKNIHEHWANQIRLDDSLIYCTYYNPSHIIRTLSEYRTVICEIVCNNYPEASDNCQTELKEKVYDFLSSQIITEEILTKKSFEETKSFLKQQVLKKHGRKKITNYDGDVFDIAVLERVVDLFIEFIDLCYKSMENGWKLIRISA